MEKLICSSCGASDFDEWFGEKRICTFCNTEFIAKSNKPMVTSGSRLVDFSPGSSALAYSYVPGLGESNYNPDGGRNIPVSVIRLENKRKKKGLFGRLFR
jgi:hypothetical protein